MTLTFLLITTILIGLIVFCLCRNYSSNRSSSQTKNNLSIKEQNVDDIAVSSESKSDSLYDCYLSIPDSVKKQLKNLISLETKSSNEIVASMSDDNKLFNFYKFVHHLIVDDFDTYKECIASLIEMVNILSKSSVAFKDRMYNPVIGNRYNSNKQQAINGAKTGVVSKVVLIGIKDTNNNIVHPSLVEVK